METIERTETPAGTRFEGTGPAVILEAAGLAIVRRGGGRDAWADFTVRGRDYTYNGAGCWTNDAAGALVPVVGRQGRTVRVRDDDRVVAVVSVAY